jgi:hypothetical protein
MTRASARATAPGILIAPGTIDSPPFQLDAVLSVNFDLPHSPVRPA